MQRDPRPLAIAAIAAAMLILLGSIAFAVASERGTPLPTATLIAQRPGTPAPATATRATPVAASTDLSTPFATPTTIIAANTAATPATPTVARGVAGSPTAAVTRTIPAAASVPTVAGTTPPRSSAPVPVPSTAPVPPVAPAPSVPVPVAPTATVPPQAPPPTPAPPPVGALAITPLQTAGLQYGFNVFLAGNSAGFGGNSAAMAKVQESGFGWVRVQLQWRELEPSPGGYNPAPYDIMIAAAANSGANVLVSVVKAPDWAAPSRPGALPEDTQAFERTMAFLASRYQGRVQAWEIWNEQNLAGEVGGNVQIAPYYETLRAGYAGVKSADPGAFVLFGGLTPTGLNDPSVAVDDVAYLRQFYEYAGGDGRNYFDALAAHPGSAANPPDTKFPEQPGPGACPPKFASQAGKCWRDAPDFYFRRIEDQRAVMEEYGDGVKQVWLTEFGWDSCQGLPAPDGYEYCALTSEQQQAEYLVRAIEIAREEWPWLGAMFVWNLNYAATPNITTDDEKYGWSVLRGDGTNRPAFVALRDLPK